MGTLNADVNLGQVRVKGPGTGRVTDYDANAAAVREAYYARGGDESSSSSRSSGSSGGSGGGGLGTTGVAAKDNYFYTSGQATNADAALNSGREAFGDTQWRQQQLADGWSGAQMDQMAGAASQGAMDAGRAAASSLYNSSMPGGADPFAAAAIMRRTGTDAAKAGTQAKADLFQQNTENQLQATNQLGSTAAGIADIGETAAGYKLGTYDAGVQQQTVDATNTSNQLTYDNYVKTDESEYDRLKKRDKTEEAEDEQEKADKRKKNEQSSGWHWENGQIKRN